MKAKRALYQVEPLARLIRRGLNKAAPHGLTEVIIAAGGLAGFRMSLDLQREKDYWLGTYEPDLQTAITDLIHPGMIAYDVGANIGYISLLLANKVSETGRVFAFEVLPENLERLKTNLELNGFTKRVELIPEAVVDTDKRVRFLVGPSGGMGKVEGSEGRHEISYAQYLELDGTSLDSFVYNQGKPAPNIIKMDIEGGEVLALSGMKRLLGEAHPLILLELHGPEAAHLSWDTLTDVGYRICRMQPGYPELQSFAMLDWKAYVIAYSGEKILKRYPLYE